MNVYWLWLLLNITIWPFAFLYFNQSMDELTGRFFGAFLYFTNFFLVPLVERKPNILVRLLSVNAIISVITLFPYGTGIFNPYIILILSILIAEGFFRLPIRHGIMVGLIGATGAVSTVFFSNLGIMNRILIVSYIIILIIAMVFYKVGKNRSDDLDARYQALLSEYRVLKRRVVSEEEIARQEERVLIAHEIHDSVGHKLTALLMQLEMFRLQIADEHKEQVESLKDLASNSLEETRSAVKSLKASDSGGLPGILRLIRKLETEKIIRIHFSVKHGAFSAPLTGEQSFVIYRAVQEALTNVMKHSQVREAEVAFEAPGGSIFRFEISNPISDNTSYQEGFGLTSMRERLEKFGGNLEVIQTEDQFVVTGFLKLDMGDLR